MLYFEVYIIKIFTKLLKNVTGLKFTDSSHKRSGLVYKIIWNLIEEIWNILVSKMFCD